MRYIRKYRQFNKIRNIIHRNEKFIIKEIEIIKIRKIGAKEVRI